METTNDLNQQEDKTIAVVSYITIIGYIIAIVLHSNNKTKLGSYHLKQASGLIVFAVASWLSLMVLGILPFIGWLVLILAPVLWIGILVLLILGLISAVNGEQKPLPIIGKFSEKWFANAFN
jgi:uncharacterized membrane protein